MRNRFFTGCALSRGMVRAVLIFLLFVGFLASMLGLVEGPVPESEDASDRVIAVGNPEPPSAALASLDLAGGALALQRQADGHFYADVQINGSTFRMLVDTGASGLALTRDDARRAGIGISIGMPSVVGRGAGGDVKGEYVTLGRVSLGGESASAVPAVVLDGGGQSLLGQSFLSRFASVEIKGDTMVLR